ncbi:hypothetical protein EDC01DRAFT_635848 [Geopyxis carbonaria]|nr:hypothetical protein EDC01DRAFT_635848 [Geopyxis carbonaria]
MTLPDGEILNLMDSGLLRYRQGAEDSIKWYMILVGSHGRIALRAIIDNLHPTMANLNDAQNTLSPEFDVYQHVNSDELNSALGHFFIQGLSEMMNPATAVAGITPVIPVAAWSAVVHSNRVRNARSPARQTVPVPAHHTAPTSAQQTTPAAAHQHPAAMADEFPCNWPDCEAVFGTPTKLRRHRDGHTARQVECPLCPAGRRLWQRVDHFQTHLLNCHWPFRPEAVVDALDTLYKVPSGGRGWLDRLRERFEETSNSAHTNDSQGNQAQDDCTESEEGPNSDESQTGAET